MRKTLDTELLRKLLIGGMIFIFVDQLDIVRGKIPENVRASAWFIILVGILLMIGLYMNSIGLLTYLLKSQNKKINEVIKYISIAILALAIATLILGQLRGYKVVAFLISWVGLFALWKYRDKENKNNVESDDANKSEMISVVTLDALCSENKKRFLVKIGSEYDEDEAQKLFLKSFEKNQYSTAKTEQKSKELYVYEQEATQDLLDRKEFNARFVELIKQLDVKNSFVIGLYGKWGCGKSSILRMVKEELDKEKDIVVIDDFTPWVYGSKETVLSQFFSLLAKKTDGLEFTPKSFQEKADGIILSAAGSLDENGILENFFKHDRDIEEDKKAINEWIDNSGKKIVIYVDNLDRMEKEKIVYLFRTIHDVINFEHTIFILSFDPEKVSQIMANDDIIGCEYLKKIINMQITVPEINKDDIVRILELSMYSTLVRLVHTKSVNSNIDEIRECFIIIVLLVSKLCNDVRDVIRFLNSVWVPELMKKSSLSFRDRVLLAALKLDNRSVYYFIKNHKKYFVTDKRAELLVESTHRDKALRGNECYDKSKYREVIAEMFPQVYGIGDRRKYYVEERIVNDRKRCGISEETFFYSYFYEEDNEYIRGKKYSSKYIDKIKNISDVGDKENQLNKLLNEIKGQDEEFKLAIVESMADVDDWPENLMLPIAKELILNCELLADEKNKQIEEETEDENENDQNMKALKEEYEYLFDNIARGLKGDGVRELYEFLESVNRENDSRDKIKQLFFESGKSVMRELRNNPMSEFAYGERDKADAWKDVLPEKEWDESLLDA